VHDLIVRGGTVVTPTGPLRADVAIDDGAIVAVEPELPGAARELLDATGLHVLPGVVDVHVHFNEPGRTEWEGFATGTDALAAGGATVAVEMPLNAHPPTLDGAAFDAKHACARAAAHVDFALWGGLVPGSLDRLDELAARGVVGFKAFMCDSGIDDFARADDLTLYEGMQRAATLGLPVAVHAESEAITRRLAARAAAAGRTAMRDFLDSRPAIAELEAIGRAILLAEETGCALHVVHVSTGRGVALVAEARARGVDVSCETCPHYLVLTDEDAERLGPLAKCAPPLRPAAEREALWAALVDGSLPMIASDHSPAPPELKGDADAFAAWGGISGCQTLLTLALTEGHHARGVALTTLAGATATFPAARLRLARKGRIEPGADADLALVDLSASAPLRSEELRYRHSHSPFAGRTLRARVVRTLLRGRAVFADGRLLGPPQGRLVRPAYHHAPEDRR
jgi:allantoinase